LVFDHLSRQVGLVHAFANLPGGLKAALAATALCGVGPGAAEGDHIGEFLCGEDCAPGQTCPICHYSRTRSESRQQPLWDSTAGSGARPGYASHGEQGRPAGLSLFCLSCHDGATASNPSDNSGRFGVAGTIGMEPGRRVGHHPYSVNYAALTDHELQPSENSRVGPLPLYGYSDSYDLVAHVECPTCHAAHSAPAEHLLRVTDKRDELCLVCHGGSRGLAESAYAQVRHQEPGPDGADCMHCHRR